MRGANASWEGARRYSQRMAGDHGGDGWGWAVFCIGALLLLAAMLIGGIVGYAHAFHL